ncbi:MAG: RdgB/HAM1 family non-canonical purine NTP pyrophosphatase [Alphaproteobacteria bacterium]|nr:RdgB/HAM1 family non-canonical purine NTP pyrophosphatase [Alphaproteobacteria bacterium]
MRKLVPGKLVIASHNAGKVREINALLGSYGIEPMPAGALGLPEPEETGTTFAENALIKARAAALGSGLPALADDSGLCVAALGGAPGVYTADWAERGPYEGLNGEVGGRDWYLAMGKVEGKLAELGADVDRSASFVCTLALVWPDGEEITFEGQVQGHLTWPPRGSKGFGYDPVFVPDAQEIGHEKSFGEITPEEKHLISHRAEAFKKLVSAVF